MSDRSDATVVTVKRRGAGRWYVFEPRSDGRHDFTEEVLTKAGTWRVVGEDIVDHVAVETPE